MKIVQRVDATPVTAVIIERGAQMEVVCSQKATFTQITTPQTGGLVSEILIIYKSSQEQFIEFSSNQVSKNNFSK